MSGRARAAAALPALERGDARELVGHMADGFRVLAAQQQSVEGRDLLGLAAAELQELLTPQIGTAARVAIRTARDHFARGRDSSEAPEARRRAFGAAVRELRFAQEFCRALELDVLDQLQALAGGEVRQHPLAGGGAAAANPAPMARIAAEDLADVFALIERVESVEGYVGATVGRGNTFSVDGKPDWRAAHAGRLSSSERQLQALLKEARALRARLRREAAPDTSTEEPG